MKTPKSFVTTISIIHLALSAGLLIFGVFQYYSNTINLNASYQKDVLVYVFPLVGLAGFFVGNTLYRKILERLTEKSKLSVKLNGYLNASIIRWGCIEAPAVLNLAWFGIKGNSLFLAVGGTLALYLLWLRPTKTKIETELALKGTALSQFRRADEPVD